MRPSDVHGAGHSVHGMADPLTNEDSTRQFDRAPGYTEWVRTSYLTARSLYGIAGLESTLVGTRLEP